MALYADITYDSRVLREAASLADSGHDVTVYCISGQSPADASFRVVTKAPDRSSVLPGRNSTFHSTTTTSRLRRLWVKAEWVIGYMRNLRAWGSWVVADAGDVDVWHAHDLPGLMAVAPLRSGGRALVYDSHEIFVDAGSALQLPGVMQRMLRLYERKLVRRATALVTVNEGYAEVLEQRLSPRRTVLVRNCPPRHDALPREASPLREATAVADDTSLMLYHGVLGANRGTEAMAYSLLTEGMQDVHAAALGFGDRETLDALADEPRFGGRLHVLEAVPPSELLGWVAGADVDIIALQHSTLNHYLCTPNKLWESLAVGVPVVVSDFPVMRKIVLDDPGGPLGAVCDPSDPASVAEAARSLLECSHEERVAMRARCLRAAHDRWNWESESARLIELYADVGNTASEGPSLPDR